MRPEQVHAIVGKTPYMSLEQGCRMAGFIEENRPRRILELGFAHGVSTCYLAAALKSVGGESVTTIDFAKTRLLQPDIADLLDACGLSDIVTIYDDPTSFTWRLMKMLEDGKGPRFDLVYLDGGHSWDVTGFAFFLVDRLLVPGGWLILDDMDWTFEISPTLHNYPFVKEMPEYYRKTPQVRKVFELLVMRHPDYGSFSIERGWGFARKKRDE